MIEHRTEGNPSWSRWLLRATAYSFVALVLARGVGILRSAALARILGPETFGTYSIVVSFLFSMLVFSSFGLPTVGAKFISEKGRTRREQGGVLSAVGLLSLGFGILLGGLVLLVSKVLADDLYHKPDLLIPLIIMAGVVPLQTLFRVGLSFLQGFKNIKLMSALTVVEALVSAVVISVFAYVARLQGAVFAWAVAGTVSIGFVTFTVMREMKRNRVHLAWPSRALFRRIFSFALPAFLAGCMVTPVYWFGDSLLSVHHGFVPVGWMAIARTLGQVALFVPAAVQIPLLPLVSESSHDDMAKEFSRVLQVNWLLSLWIALFIGLSGRYLVPFVYGEDYSGANSVVFLYSVTIFLIAICGINSSVLVGTGRIWQGFGLNLCWAILFVVSAYLAVPMWGVHGLLVSYLASYFLFAVAVLAYVKNRLMIRMPMLRGYVVYSIVFISSAWYVVVSFDGYGYLMGSFLILTLGGIGGLFLFLPPDYRSRIMHGTTNK